VSRFKFKFGRGIVEVPYDINFTVDTVEVRVGLRRITARWTPEMVQDVRAFQGIDAEAELTALLSEQMAHEIDREILMDIRLGQRYVMENILNIRPFKFGR